MEKDEVECLKKDGTIYIGRRDSEGDELQVILEQIGIQLSDEQIEAILSRTAPADVRSAREEVRKCSLMKSASWWRWVRPI